MFELRGKFASAIIYADSLEDTATQQIYSFLNNKAFADMTIRIMPDCHAGTGCVIGFTSTCGSKIIPNLIGVDIGCGVVSCKLTGVKDINFQALDTYIRTNVPNGKNVHNSQSNAWILHDLASNPIYSSIEDICKHTEQPIERVMNSIGTLGGGNHFIEIDKDQNDAYWLTLHSGSRNFGLKIANYWQSIAKAKVGGSEGVMNGLEYLEYRDAEDYIYDMMIAQEYAHLNRYYMLRIIYNFFTLSHFDNDYIESVHNYINFNDNIIRKGAISAHAGEKVIIPWNMRDGLIIGLGKGNSEWNYSAPHGAGRIMGRNAAKKTIDLEDFTKSMDGIWTSCVSMDTIDESPMAYKDTDTIKEIIKDTVDIQYTLKPVYNFKASE